MSWKRSKPGVQLVSREFIIGDGRLGMMGGKVSPSGLKESGVILWVFPIPSTSKRGIRFDQQESSSFPFFPKVHGSAVSNRPWDFWKLWRIGRTIAIVSLLVVLGVPPIPTAAQNFPIRHVVAIFISEPDYFRAKIRAFLFAFPAATGIHERFPCLMSVSWLNKATGSNGPFFGNPCFPAQKIIQERRVIVRDNSVPKAFLGPLHASEGNLAIPKGRIGMDAVFPEHDNSSNAPVGVARLDEEFHGGSVWRKG
jgi:hypothetical protein